MICEGIAMALLAFGPWPERLGKAVPPREARRA